MTLTLKARIVITTFNSDNHLHRCVESLSNQSCMAFEVVIVNNGRSPIIQKRKWESYTWLSILQANENRGFSGGSNLGAKGANAEWIITLNPDAWPEPEWFANLMKAAKSNPTYVMLSSTLLQAENPSTLDGAGDQYSIYGIGWRGGQDRPVSCLPLFNREVLAPCGAAAAYRRNIFINNKGFDEGYFCYLEDLDLGLRLQLQGQKCLHVYNAKVLHVGGGSTGVNSYFQLYHTHKNQLRLILKTTPTPLLLMQLPLYFIGQTYLLLKTFGTLHWIAKIHGLRDGMKSSYRVINLTRPQVQKQRIISIRQFNKLLSYSILNLRRKDM